MDLFFAYELVSTLSFKLNKKFAATQNHWDFLLFHN